MKTMETITSFFKRAELLFRPGSSFCGRLDESLVQSRKRVIVFEYPRILQSTDTPEEATTFLLKEKEDGRALHAAVYRHDTDMWHKMDLDLIQSRLQVEEKEDVVEQTTGEKVMETITSFFRRADFELRRASGNTDFCGRLDGSLVQSGKRVIVFEYPNILHATDSLEEATAFLLRVQEAGKARRAAVYKHDADAWCKVDIAGRQARPPTLHAPRDSSEDRYTTLG